MAGHIDVSVLIRAPVASTWAITNDPRAWSGGGQGVEVDPTTGALRFRVTTSPDDRGRTWTYGVVRTPDAATRTVYSRRTGSCEFLYAHTWYHYAPEDEGTRLRCVIDFEMAHGGEVGDFEMEEIIGRATARAMEDMASRVESQLACMRCRGEEA